MNKLIILIFLIFFTSTCKSTSKDVKENNLVFSNKKDSIIFGSLNDKVYDINKNNLSRKNRIIPLAKLFLKTEYKPNTLNCIGDEKLIVNLREFDCATYVDNVLALSLLDNNICAKDFYNNLIILRYRTSKVNRYLSRLHYFSEWICINEEKHLFKNISNQIGGVLLDKKINFMSTHENLYPKLQASADGYNKIKIIENNINRRKHYYIPQENIAELEKNIHDGDIIAITTKTKGLLVSHTGFAIFINNRLHLIHASSKHKKVIVSENTLSDMILSNKLQTGIVVVRMI